MFKPLLASKVNLETLKFPVIASPKADGFRCIVNSENVPTSRNLKPIPNKHIRETMQNWKMAYLDGELVTVNEETGQVDDFSTIQSKVTCRDGKPNFQFLVFDSHRVPTAPFIERFDEAATTVAIMRSYGNGFVLTLSQFEIKDSVSLNAFEEDCVDEGWEGIMIRDPNGIYKYGRSTVNEQILLKLKRFDDDEATIIGLKELMRNENEAQINKLGHTERSSAKDGLSAGGMLGAFTVRLASGVEFEIGTGFTEDDRLMFWLNPNHCIGRKVSFRYQGLMPSGKPRFPSFKGFRDTK